MREINLLRRLVLAGALAVSMTGLSASIGGAEAMPIAATPSQVGSTDVTAVQYAYRPYRRSYRRPRRAGLYNCGPGGLDTHLARKACGYAGPAQRYLYGR